MANKFLAAVKKAKSLYKTGRYKTFAKAVKAAYGKTSTPKKKTARKKRRVAAVKFIERGETRRTKPKKVYRITRSRTGTFKKTKSVSGSPNPRGITWQSMAKKWTKDAQLHSLKEQVKGKLAKACADYEFANTVKATKEAQKRKIKYRKILKSL